MRGAGISGPGNIFWRFLTARFCCHSQDLNWKPHLGWKWISPKTNSWKPFRLLPSYIAQKWFQERHNLPGSYSIKQWPACGKLPSEIKHHRQKTSFCLQCKAFQWKHQSSSMPSTDRSLTDVSCLVNISDLAYRGVQFLFFFSGFFYFK